MSVHNPSVKTPAQQIKRLERELAKEIVIFIINTMIDIYDKDYGINLKKSVTIVSGNSNKTDK